MEQTAKIEVLNNFSKNGIIFLKGETYFATILSIGYSGGFEKYGNNTMDGAIDPCAIIHIYEVWPDSNQKAIGLLTNVIIDYNVRITYDI